jgi:hypothetical protein
LGDNPRRFANAEIAAIRRALALTYGRYDWETELLADHSLTPTLETFCHKLYRVAEQAGGGRVAAAAALLAEEIESLYVLGDYAETFNRPTNLDLTLKERIVLFDFSQVPERRRPLFYYAVLAGINHQIRRNPRKRAIFVDEVHYMSQEGSLMTFLAHMVKTVRTFGAAVIMIDQDLEAFIGVKEAQAQSMAAGLNVAAGQFILNNLDFLMSFGVPRDAAVRLMEMFPGVILSSHVEFLTQMGSDDQLGKGMALIARNGRADTVYVQLRPIEAACLLGS